jgi:hypothetical protein
MRRHLRALLTACVLAYGAAPLAAIEYHTQEDTLPDPPGGSTADPLAEIQASDAGILADGSSPGMFEGFCDTCCDCCDGWGFDGIYRPRAWIARVDVMALQRSEPQDDTVFTDSTGLVFSADLLGPQTEVGGDVSIMEIHPDGDGAEFRFFILDNVRAERDVLATDPLIFTTPPTGPIAGANAVNVYTDSRLRSMEAHFMEASYYGTWMIGARYLDLDESLVINTRTLAPGPVTLTRSSFLTENELVGLQIGYGAMLYDHNCWRLQFVGKGGVYYAEQDSSVIFNSNVGLNGLGTEDNESVATVGELRLTLSYQFSPAWAFRCGYEFLFIDGVALATEQEESTANMVSGPLFDTDINLGTVWYQGGLLGLEYNF